MKLLGYAGSAAACQKFSFQLGCLEACWDSVIRWVQPEADPLKRGVEGCMPGTSGAEMPRGYNSKKDAEEAPTPSGPQEFSLSSRSEGVAAVCTCQPMARVCPTD